jgi:hypothetical protein
MRLSSLFPVAAKGDRRRYESVPRAPKVIAESVGGASVMVRRAEHCFGFVLTITERGPNFRSGTFRARRFRTIFDLSDCQESLFCF